MHLNGQVLGLYFLPALANSISSFDERIRHDSSLYVSGFLFFVNKVDLHRLFLEILDHNFLPCWLIDVIDACLWKFIVPWISDILMLLFFLFWYLHRNWLKLFEIHFIRLFGLILHAFVEIFIKGKSATKAFGFIEIVPSRTYTRLIMFAPPWSIRHGIALFLMIDALMQPNDGLFQRLVGQFVPKRDNSLKEVIYRRRSFRSVCRCGDDRFHGSIVEVRVILIDVPVRLRFPRKD